MTSQTQHQIVTAELRRWIQGQLRLGHGPDAMLDAMLASGWHRDVAIQALESTLREHQAQQDTAPGMLPSVREPGPDPRLRESPLHLDLGDRTVTVLMTLAHPHVVLLGDFLSDEECDELIAAATHRMARSTTVSSQPEGEEVHESRTSNGMFFRRGENDIVRRIEARIARLLHWPVEYGEGIQVLQYRPGAEYRPHYDYFNPDEPATAGLLQRGGQRVATVVMYLNNPEKGGATTFPDIQLEVAPRRGNAVFFSYPRAHPSTGTLHGGAPVIAGEKWIATKWLREREFS